MSELQDFEKKDAKPQTYLFYMHLRGSLWLSSGDRGRGRSFGMDEEKRKKNEPLNGGI